MRSRILSSIATLCAVVPGLAAIVTTMGAAAAESTTVDALPPLSGSTSLLVVSPHPDDESLCCAGAIQRVLHAGGRVSIVWITSGDGSELDLLVVENSLFAKSARLRDLAQKRMQESRNAAGILGVAPECLFFLGYPDRGILAIITDNFITPYRSRFTDAAAVPYATALFPGHPYTGQSLERDFESVLDRVRPTLILAPSPRDMHPDHRAAGILTLRTMARRNEPAVMRYWIVHGGKLWPLPHGYDPALALRPPPRSRGLSPASFRLLPAEIQRKNLAINAYHTQMEVMSSFLLSFVRTNELYSAMPVPQDGADD